MKMIIFYTLMILAVISMGTAFAQESLITVETDESNYHEGDTIVISGEVSTIIGETQITMQLFKGANMVEIAQIKVSQDGNYVHTIIAQGPLWKNQGDYTVRTVYGENNIAETAFEYTSELQTTETTKEFPVDAGDSGTFDIKYTIRGGLVESIDIEPENLGLSVKINSSNNGKIILELPREFIDSEKQNGKDEEFIILINDVQTTYEEIQSDSEIRSLGINFEKGDSEIQIIGTYVIPEFGTIVMIILTIGILASILLTKNKFQIKI
ncbi:PEFG-CTERM sorting domain-containing protein [Nitrosopumilus sp.]|nr:PEFG-CTERM sorting domain-containing protein [Nitrosopumilus sp.]